MALDAPPFVQDLPLAREAFRFAQALHAPQHREWDGAPFILHPLEVASLLHASGWGDEVVATAMLHDLLEDTDAAGEELRERFGDRVAGLVTALTEDETIEDYAERKAALRRQAVGPARRRARSSPPTRSPRSASCAPRWPGRHAGAMPPGSAGSPTTRRAWRRWSSTTRRRRWCARQRGRN